jgi:hypothetical protein
MDNLNGKKFSIRYDGNMVPDSSTHFPSQPVRFEFVHA